MTIPKHIALCSVALIAALPTYALCAEPDVQPGQVVTSLEGTFGVHPGERRNHIKGTCAAGEFVGTKEAAAYSKSGLFSGAAVPVVARFSLAGGNPKVPDTAISARGLAIEFRLPGGNRQHMTMLNMPVFVAAQPATFNDLIIASKPDPATGKPDTQKMQAFFASHPETMASTSFMKQHNPPANYFSSAFYSIHTFKFIDAKNVEHLIKWRFVPQTGEKALTDAELRSAPHDFLEKNLITQLKTKPAKWDMIVYLGQAGDPDTNPTLSWPESREHFKAGTLSITTATPQAGAECEKINFDPLVMADGIAPTNDPILLFRSPAYAISFGKRLSGQ
jgi:catalase